MQISAFDIFKVGIGPSSSHTVGPMRAAGRFIDSVAANALLAQVASVQVELYGSLGATGKGHGTDRGVMLGLMGYHPETIDPALIGPLIDAVRTEWRILLKGCQRIDFNPREAIQFYRRALAEHPNGLVLTARDVHANILHQARFLSVGGGFVVEMDAQDTESGEGSAVPYPFSTGRQLLQHCADSALSVAQVMLANELVLQDADQVRTRLLAIWQVMQQCVRRGIGVDQNTSDTFAADAPLPGPLKVRRRAPALFRELTEHPRADDAMEVMDWVNLYAIAVNEENAAGGRVVTAPTNGAAGIIPSVLHYYARFIPGSNDDGIVDFLLTAAAIAVLYKENASISGAAVGCQGEVGVACSMAAGALAHVMGGTPAQVENAAEIGMEHNLGLTCDPVGGLVQIPCIERNAMGAVKAINAARIALRGDGVHQVSLDAVIETMRQTGADMKTKYKETSRGGLAVNIVEC